MRELAKLRLFISYSHRDEGQINRFKKHLAPLKEKGLISEWHDRKIMAGEDFQKSINDHLEDADIICLFISPDFLDSQECKKEVTKSLELKKKKGISVIPIILSECGWSDMQNISSLLVLPTDGKPVSSFERSDIAWKDVYEGLKRVIQKENDIRSLEFSDEVARMVAEQNFGGTPKLVLEWADIEKRVVLPSPHPVKSLFLEPLLPDDTFDKHRPLDGSTIFATIGNFDDNENYSKEVVFYTWQMAFLKSFGLRLFNDSGTVGQRVRFVGSVTKDNAIIVLDSTRQPERPHRNHMDGILRSTVPLSQQLRSDPDPRVRELDDRWEITIDFGDVRPREDIWTTNPLFIGSINGITRLEGKLQGDNIPEPIPCVLEVSFEVKQRPMERSDVEPYLNDR